jgi:hypothetical protein
MVELGRVVHDKKGSELIVDSTGEAFSLGRLRL